MLPEACDERIYTGLPTESKRVVDASAGSAERNVVERALASDTCVALHVRQSQRHERQITGLPNPKHRISEGIAKMNGTWEHEGRLSAANATKSQGIEHTEANKRS